MRKAAAERLIKVIGMAKEVANHVTENEVDAAPNRAWSNDGYPPLGLYKSGIIPFEDLERALLEFEPQLAPQLSQIDIASLSWDVLRSLHFEGEAQLAAFLENKIADLMARPFRKWDVERPLRGGRLSEGPIELGQVTLLSVNESRWRLPFATGTSIVTRLDAVDNAHAAELADVRFRRAESILRYILARRHSVLGRTMVVDEVGIFELSNVSSIPLRATSDGLEAQNFGQQFPLQEVVLSREKLLDPREGYDILWQITSKQSPSEMEARILSAVEWIALSLHDTEVPRSFIQVAFALEVLLKAPQVDPLQPSIAAQLSEAVALICGQNLVERRELMRSVKSLYRDRSRVAHEGRRTVSHRTLDHATALTRSVVRKLLTDPILCELQTPAELQEWIENRKLG